MTAEAQKSDLFADNERAYDIVFKGAVEMACIKAARDLQLFEVLVKGPCDLMTLAQATESVPPRLERLLIAMQQLGLVVKEGDAWDLTPLSRQFFVAPAPQQNLTMIPFVDFIASQMETYYLRLADVVRGQKDYTSIVPYPPLTRQDNQLYETIHRSNAYFPIKFLCERAKLDTARHLIDVGGGIGDIASALCEQHPQLTVTLLNLPGALDLVRENVAARGLNDRITPVAVDMYREPYPRGDALLFGRILYPINEQICTMLCRKAYEALEPGGRIIIIDMIISDPQKPNYDYLSHYLCAVGMAFSVLEFKSHTIYPDILQRAGFRDIQFDEAYGHVLYQAVK